LRSEVLCRNGVAELDFHTVKGRGPSREKEKAGKRIEVGIFA